MTPLLVLLVLIIMPSTAVSTIVSTEKDKYDVRHGGGGVATSSSGNSGSRSSHHYLQKIKAQNERAEKDPFLLSHLTDAFVNPNVANNINTNTERRTTTRAGKDARSKGDLKTIMGKGKTGNIDNELDSTCEIDVST
jgi:hypothetical protein